jgi:transcription initiation factor TFIIH subunit 4
VRNDLHVTLLAFFAQILYRLPNMAVAALTRDSVSAALAKGITADTILEFIEYHAHPEMLAQVGPRGPPEIGEQLRLWESERHRVRYAPAVLLDAFPSPALYARAREYAEDCGVCLYADPVQRLLVVEEGGAGLVRTYMARHGAGE